MPQRQCTAIAKSGARCRAPALPDDDTCFTHSPAVAAKRAERNRRGGLNKRSEARAFKAWVVAGERVAIADLPKLLLGMAEAVATGELEPARASAISRLITTALTVAAHVGWEVRLQELEDALQRIEMAHPGLAQQLYEQRRAS